MEKQEPNYHASIYEKLDYFYESNKIPHIIFHGSYGSGKRTIVNTFINKIYGNDKKKIKTNVMYVDCAHGKGIKFIRDELKFFAKTNIHICSQLKIGSQPTEAAKNNGIMFKTIVLLNAEHLTIDAQSALRRCIELFSYNTRFFIIVENKEKLLNPIISRFCEIYVPEFQPKSLDIYDSTTSMNQIEKTMVLLYENKKVNMLTHVDLVFSVNDFYENGISCLEIISWIKNTDTITEIDKYKICIFFDKIKAEYRSEKLLMLYFLDFLLLRSNKDVKSISSI